MVVHVVLFKLKDRSPGSIARAAEMLRSLAGKVPVIRGIEVGSDVLRSDRSYDIALVVRFESLRDLEAYQSHPEHVKVAEYIASVRETVAVVDYEE